MKNHHKHNMDLEVDSEGTAFLIFNMGFSLFAISEPNYWKHQDNSELISYSCVGGKLEEGESAIEAGKRESYEELGIDVRIHSSKVTYLIDFQLNKQVIEFNQSIKPFAIYYTKFSEKPGEDSENWSLLGRVYVYFASLLGDPFPSSEIPALLWLKWEDMLFNISNPMRFNEILSKGLIIEKVEIPNNSYFIPVMTPEIIGKVFGKITGNLK